MACQHLSDRKEPLLCCSLKGPAPAPARMKTAVKESVAGAEGIFTSTTCVVNHRAVCKGDVVMMKDGGVAEVWFHARVDGYCWSCVSPWRRASQTRSEGSFLKASEPALVP
eukprot:4435251-Pyramimonas_sp.AAC.1